CAGLHPRFGGAHLLPAGRAELTPGEIEDPGERTVEVERHACGGGLQLGLVLLEEAGEAPLLLEQATQRALVRDLVGADLVGPGVDLRAGQVGVGHVLSVWRRSLPDPGGTVKGSPRGVREREAVR